MPRKKNDTSSSDDIQLKTSLTPEARESYLISLAFDLVERRLKDGTASSQETTTLIKYGSRERQLELEKLQNENALLQAKVKNLESQEHSEELYLKALEAMRSYGGGGTNNGSN